MEVWLSMPMTKDTVSTGNFCGLLRMSEGLEDDGEGKVVQMKLRRLMLFENLLPMRTLCPLLLGLLYRLH